ncbi:MAG: hypothetical protein K0S33_2038 [Bacteroidetes bacterium]|jgi:hypothetical protein|nr:hypothetical protein [Bacteroidota bacterium]
MKIFHKKTVFFASLICLFLISCNRHSEFKDKEQLSVSDSGPVEEESDSTANSIAGNLTIDQLSTTPNAVILTGLPDHRFLTIYKSKAGNKKAGESSGSREYYYSYDGYESGSEEHFMPGIDILYGFNLLNLAHYDMKTGKTNVLFKKSALIKNFYYPSIEPDSINKIPVRRNYYLLSVYDEDTNKDKVVSRKDLRKFYYLDAGCTTKTQLIPDNYCVMRSQYDTGNDALFIYARYDQDKNGAVEKKEPMHVFCIDLKNPVTARRVY